MNTITDYYYTSGDRNTNYHLTQEMKTALSMVRVWFLKAVLKKPTIMT